MSSTLICAYLSDMLMLTHDGSMTLRTRIYWVVKYLNPKVAIFQCTRKIGYSAWCLGPWGRPKTDSRTAFWLTYAYRNARKTALLGKITCRRLPKEAIKKLPVGKDSRLGLLPQACRDGQIAKRDPASTSPSTGLSLSPNAASILVSTEKV